MKRHEPEFTVSLGSGFAPSHYNVLEVDERATGEELRHAFRKLAWKHHQDTAGTYDAQVVSTLTTAYFTLADPRRRARYDSRHIGLERPGTGPARINRKRTRIDSGLLFIGVGVMSLALLAWFGGSWLAQGQTQAWLTHVAAQVTVRAAQAEWPLLLSAVRPAQPAVPAADTPTIPGSAPPAVGDVSPLRLILTPELHSLRSSAGDAVRSAAPAGR